MRILDRYIGTVVAVHCLTVLAVLLTVYFFSAFVTELGDVGKGRYDFFHAVLYSLMMLPRQAYEIFPLVALLGAILGLGSLANTSELAVIRAAGISIQRILLAVVKTGVVLVIVVAVLGEVIAPPLEKMARLKRAEAMSEKFSVSTGDALWGKDGNTFIHIEKFFSSEMFAKGMSFYEFDDDGALIRTTHAADARYRDNAWELDGVNRFQISEQGIEREYLVSERWKTSLKPEVLNIIAVPPENLSVWDLQDYVTYMDDNNLDARQYKLSFWIKIMAPLATLGMVLLAVPFVVGSLRNVSVGQRIMTGSLLGIGFYLFNAIFSRVGIVYDIPPLLSASVPTLIVFILWGYMMHRVQT